MAQIAYVDWDGLVYYDGKIKQYLQDIVDGCLKAGGKIPFAQLPRPSYDNLNYVYKITDSFTSTNDFDKPGYKYEVGALVQVEDFDKNNTYRYTVIYEPIKVADVSGKVEELERAVEEHSVDIGALANDVDSLYSLLEDSYAKKADIPSVEGLASEDYVDQAVSDALANVDINDAQVTANTHAISALSETVSEVSKEIISVEEQVENVASATDSLGATIDVIQEQLSTKADNVHTHKLSEIDDYTPPNLAPYATTEWVNKQDFLQQQDLNGYAKSTDIPTKVSELSNDKEFVTESYVEEQLSKKADSKHLHDNYATVDSIPTKVSTLENDKGYVTTTELNSKGYITEHQSLEDYAKTSEIPKKVSSLINDAGYLTKVPDEYITNNELQSKGYLTYIPSEYITSEELDARGYIDHHQSLEGYVKFAELANYYRKSNTYSKVEVDNALAKKADASSVSSLSVEVDKKATKEEVKAKLDTSIYDADKIYYALKSEIVKSYNDLTDKPDIDGKIDDALDGYATESFVAEEIAKAQLSGGEGGVDETTLNNLLSNYYKKSETYSKGEVNSLIPNIDGYATQQWVTDKGYITALDISGKADKADIPNSLSELTNDKGFITAEDFPNYIPESYVTNDELIGAINDITIPTKTSDLTNDSGFLTSHQSLNGYATESWVEGKKYLVASDISDKLDTATYNEDKATFLTAESLNGYAKTEDIPTDYLTSSDLEGYSKFSGSYNDLTDTPVIPSVEGLASTEYVDSKADKEHNHSYNDLTDKPEIPSINGLATEQYVDDAISNLSLPDVDPTNLVTHDALANALLVKADDVPFTTDMRVTTPVGGFTSDETLQNLTVAQILTKLLGLTLYVPPTTDIPESTPEVAVDIITNSIPTYVLSEDGSLVESEYGEDFYVEMSAAEAKADNQEESFFYQIVDEGTGVVTETGYQVVTPYQEIDYLTVLIPNTITNFHVEEYSALAGDWSTPTWKLVENPTYQVDGYTAYTVPEEYGVMSGIAIRIVIDN